MISTMIKSLLSDFCTNIRYMEAPIPHTITIIRENHCTTTSHILLNMALTTSSEHNILIYRFRFHNDEPTSTILYAGRGHLPSSMYHIHIDLVCIVDKETL